MKIRIACLVLGTSCLVACGYKSPTQSSGAPGPSGGTITISATGVQPVSVTVPKSYSVSFVNADGVSHYILPLPGQNADCGGVSGVGVIASGETKLTFAFPSARSCTFYDYNNAADPRWQGTIVIQ